MTFEEFVRHIETFAQDNHEPGTLRGGVALGRDGQD